MVCDIQDLLLVFMVKFAIFSVMKVKGCAVWVMWDNECGDLFLCRSNRNTLANTGSLHMVSNVSNWLQHAPFLMLWRTREHAEHNNIHAIKSVGMVLEKHHYN